MLQNLKTYKKIKEILENIKEEIDFIERKNKNSKSTIESFLLNTNYHYFIIDKFLNSKEKIYLLAILKQKDFYDTVNDIWEKMKDKEKQEKKKKQKEEKKQKEKENWDISIKNITIWKEGEWPYSKKIRILNKIIEKWEDQKLLQNEKIFNKIKEKATIWKILNLLNNIKSYTNLNFYPTISNIKKYKTEEFKHEENAMYYFLKYPYIWENNFDSYYQEMYKKYKKNFFTSLDKKANYRINQLHTYKNLLDLYKYISKSSFLKLIIITNLMKMNNIFNNSFSAFLLWTLFWKDEKDIKKIIFFFKPKQENKYTNYLTNSLIYINTIFTLFIIILISYLILVSIWIIGLILLFLIIISIVYLYKIYKENYYTINFSKFWILNVYIFFILLFMAFLLIKAHQVNIIQDTHKILVNIFWWMNK